MTQMALIIGMEPGKSSGLVAESKEVNEADEAWTEEEEEDLGEDELVGVKEGVSRG